MSSANAFKLDWSKILLFDKELCSSLPNNKNIDWSELKAFAEDKISVNEIMTFLPFRIENIQCGKWRKFWLPAFSSIP